MCKVCKAVVVKRYTEEQLFKIAKHELEDGVSPEHVSDVLASIMDVELKERDLNAEAAWERENHFGEDDACPDCGGYH